MAYYLFERDLTSDHVSYHYCFLDYEKVSFIEKSKIKNEYEYIRNILSHELTSIRGLNTFHKAITPPNKFIRQSYFHLSVNSINKNEYELINNIFGLNINNRYGYFTKLVDDIGKKTNFKCGFLLNEFNSIDHKMKNDAKDLAKNFNGGEYNVLYAFDFDKNGNVIHDNINIELLPSYSVDSFLNIKQKLLEYFPHINKSILDKYETMFKDYNPSKFHFHFKIKLYNDCYPTVKFYRTYNSKNPYIR